MPLPSRTPATAHKPATPISPATLRDNLDLKGYVGEDGGTGTEGVRTLRSAEDGFQLRYRCDVHSIDIASVIFEEGWNRQDFSNVQRLLAHEFPLHIGGDTRITNADEFATVVGTWHAAFPDFRFDIHSITADDHMAAVRATLNGTHKGPWGDMQPTGRSIAVEHAFFLRIEGGLVTEVWEILDRAALETQLTSDQGT